MINNKLYLDSEGLALYDQLIKAYVDKKASSSDEALQAAKEEILGVVAASANQLQGEIDAEAERAQAAEEEIANDLVAEADRAKAAEKANADAIAVLNGDEETEGSVAKSVKDAIDALVDEAPEALDTLKEIADWIKDDETGTANLIDRVADIEDKLEQAEEENEEALEDLKAYIDAQDLAYYNAIGSIEDLNIIALFPVEQKAEESVADAIAALEDRGALKLAENQEVEGDIVIDKSCHIDANGSTFTGTVTVPADADVVIVNATFANPVVVA